MSRESFYIIFFCYYLERVKKVFRMKNFCLDGSFQNHDIISNHRIFLVNFACCSRGILSAFWLIWQGKLKDQFTGGFHFFSLSSGQVTIYRRFFFFCFFLYLLYIKKVLISGHNLKLWKLKEIYQFRCSLTTSKIEMCVDWLKE